MYAEIKEGVVKQIHHRPRWYSGHPDNGGHLLSDAELVEVGVLPLIDEKPAFNNITQTLVENPVAEWTIESNRVIKTYTVLDLTPQEVQENLNRKKEELVFEVNYIRDSLIDSGIVMDGIRFETRPADRENIAGAVQLATLSLMQNEPFELNWIASDGSVHLLDSSKIIALGKAVAERKAEVLFRAHTVRSLVASAESWDTLPNIAEEMRDRAEDLPIPPDPNPVPAP